MGNTPTMSHPLLFHDVPQLHHSDDKTGAKREVGCSEINEFREFKELPRFYKLPNLPIYCVAVKPIANSDVVQFRAAFGCPVL